MLRRNARGGEITWRAAVRPGACGSKPGGEREASGKLEQMLERVAHLKMFLTLFEPAMILLMGGVMLMIVLAILLPIVEPNHRVR